jgi:putative transposase
MDWARILAFVTGMVDQELLARNEYLAAENRILKAQLKGRLKLSDAERATLGEIGHRLGRKVLGEVANVARPDTILAWYRKLVARKFDGSKARRSPGRPRIKGEVEQLIVRMAKENRDWGYDRIAGALANLIWGTRSAIRRSAMSCNATLCRPRPSASARQPGRLSFGSIWRCWLGPTS